MNKVRIGILGCAGVAQKYAIKAFQSIPHAEVIALASRDYAKAQEWADRFGVRAEKSYADLLACQDIDAVYIPLPIGLHEEWVRKAAEAGKHILCEKSLADSFRSVQKMVKVCRDKGVVLYENFMCDFHPQHSAVQSLMADGKIGTPLVFQGYFGFPPFPSTSFRYNPTLGGGSLNDAGSYTVFMARKMFGEPLAVTAMLNTAAESQVDVHGSILMEFSSSRTALLSFGFDNVYQNNYSIWGTKGLIKVSRAYSIPPDLKPPVEVLTNEQMKETITSLNLPAANHFELIFSDFCDTILRKDGQKREMMYAKIVAQGKVLEAIRISAREKRRVPLSELDGGQDS